MISQHVYEVRPRKDKRGFDLISDALPSGRLWYAGSAYKTKGRYRTLRTVVSTSKWAPSLRGRACGLGRAPIGFFRLWSLFRRGLEFRGISFPI